MELMCINMSDDFAHVSRVLCMNVCMHMCGVITAIYKCKDNLCECVKERGKIPGVRST